MDKAMGHSKSLGAQSRGGKAGSNGPAFRGSAASKRFQKGTLLSIALLFLFFDISWATEKSIVTEVGTVESFGDVRLSEILELASRGNPNIAAAKEKVAQAREDARSAAAAMGPTVSIGASARYETDRNAYNASLNLIQTLYAGGSLRANRRAAELSLSAVESESARTYQEVLNEVRVRYYDCLRAGAKAIVTDCPMCQANVESRQLDHASAEPALPVFYAAELVAAAISGRYPAAQRKAHLVDPGVLDRFFSQAASAGEGTR